MNTETPQTIDIHDLSDFQLQKLYLEISIQNRMNENNLNVLLAEMLQRKQKEAESTALADRLQASQRPSTPPLPQFHPATASFHL